MESLGARLKREREKRKITLEEVSLSTKIGTRFLIAIEQENFDQLPGGIFNKGFVKAYARSVGVDEAEAAAEYELATAPPLPEVLPESDPESAGTPASTPAHNPAFHNPALHNPAFHGDDPGNGASRIPWEWFAAALLIVAFGFALWGFHSREKSFPPSPLPATAENTSAATPTAIAQTAPPQSTPAQAADKNDENKDAAPPLPVATIGNAASPPSDSAPAPDRPPDPARTPSALKSTALKSTPGAFLVQIKAREDSWVAIIADGRQIMQATLSAAAEKSIGARDQIVIKTGNAGALDISFNGKKLPAQGAPNEVKTLTFDPNGPKF